MSKHIPHQITVEQIEAMLRHPTRILLASCVGPKSDKHFYVGFNANNLNPYTFEVETISNGIKMKWDSNEPESMVKRYNELP
jgi:hypothetical protein